ncbi:MAG: hypothetical protein QM582_03400 [Micropruina sp.]|uniref:hypothetical protein n=1 Tax=Micropruina sp. TaxID=2737536 RepID=UPI0039E4DC0E
MSFVVHFVADAALPDSPESQDDSAHPSVPLSAEEIATWERLHPALIALLPAGSHDVAANRFSRQLVHERSGLLVTWAHEDYQASLPFWSVNASADTFDVLVRVTEAIESETGLVGVDEISRARFLDHHAEVAESFRAIADGFEEAMDSQTVLGWVRNLFHRRH